VNSTPWRQQEAMLEAGQKGNSTYPII